MASYYTGVPIGGSIWFLGGLVGLDIPENFVENSEFSIGTADPRKAAEFNYTSLPYVDKGYMAGYNAPAVITSSGNLSKSLVLNNLPQVSKTKTIASLDVPEFTPSQVGGMFDVTLNGTTAGLTSGGVNNYNKREVIYTNSTTYNWSYDTVDDRSGTGYRLLGTTSTGSVYSREAGTTHDHGDYKAGSTETHNHTKNKPSVTWEVSDAVNVKLNDGTKAAISYTRPRTPSTGAVLITRIW